MNELQWEDIFIRQEDGKIGVGTWRAKVLDGWLVANTVIVNHTPSTALIFIKDKDHKWSEEIKHDESLESIIASNFNPEQPLE